jgi:hypothetical protein
LTEEEEELFFSFSSQIRSLGFVVVVFVATFKKQTGEGSNGEKGERWWQ